ncbi:MAG: hypothetical protein V4669_02685 [Pseudomonadota bacterium]
MKINCRPGDLAVVVTAENVANIGRIVRIIGPHSGRGKLAMMGRGQVWLAACPQAMTWTIGSRIFLRTKGPIPDECLRPIRGNPARDSLEVKAGSPVGVVGGGQ